MNVKSCYLVSAIILYLHGVSSTSGEAGAQPTEVAQVEELGSTN